MTFANRGRALPRSWHSTSSHQIEKLIEHDIETPPIEGCGWTTDKVKKLLSGNPEAEAMWEKALTAPPGKHVSDTYIVSRNKQGNSRAYGNRILAEKAPEHFDRVKRGEISTHAAMIEAGLRKPRQSPFEIACRQIPKLTPEERHKLICPREERYVGTAVPQNISNSHTR